MKKTDKDIMNESWAKMHALLDVEMPQNKRRKPVFVWWAAACILLFGGLFRLRQIPEKHIATSIVAVPSMENTAATNQTTEFPKEANISLESAAIKPQMPVLKQAHANIQSVENEKHHASNLIVTHDARLTSTVTIQANTEHLDSGLNLPSQPITTQTDAVVSVVPKAENTQNSVTDRQKVQNEHPVLCLPHLEVDKIPMGEPVLALAAPAVQMKKRKQISLGLRLGIGSGILPVPSSGLALAECRYALGNGFQILGNGGVNYLSFGNRSTVVVEVPQELLDNTTASSDVISYLNSSADHGAYPSLKSALYYQFGLGFTKHLGSRMFAGISTEYHTLRNVNLGSSSLKRSASFNTNGYDPALLADVDKALSELGEEVVAKNAIALQMQLGWNLNKNLSLTAAYRAILSKGHPEPIALQFSAVYSPVWF